MYGRWGESKCQQEGHQHPSSVCTCVCVCVCVCVRVCACTYLIIILQVQVCGCLFLLNTVAIEEETERIDIDPFPARVGGKDFLHLGRFLDFEHGFFARLVLAVDECVCLCVCVCVCVCGKECWEGRAGRRSVACGERRVRPLL